LTFQRFILDRALQPVDSFDGFLWVDQFRESAVRYQLNYAQWSLALAHYQCTPAFQGYLALAQRRLIEKMTYRKVWQYWRWENLWGNFRYDADPIRRDNIMLSGYYALMLGVYETLSGDQRFNLPGCLEFRLNQRRTFEYDAVSISEAVFANMNRAKYCMFPCDPNWVYSVCNTIGMTALITMDRLHATDHAGELISRFRRAFEDEFISADGRPLVFRSNRMGIAIPGIGASSANELGTVFWLSPVLHDLATRTWLLNRDRIMQGVTQPLIQSPVDKMDLGNYQLTWGPIWYGMAMAAAKEMGDTEAYEVIVSGLECAVERELSSGVDRDDVDRAAPYPATVAANLWMGPGVFGGERAWHDLIIYGLPKEHHDWPMLADAPYPDALVARAVSDGRSLELVLLPGESASQVELGFANLIPGRSYVRHGAEAEGFTAGPDGTASLRIELAGRTELRLVPTQDTTGP
jgi:hypothetical protein